MPHKLSDGVYGERGDLSVTGGPATNPDDVAVLVAPGLCVELPPHAWHLRPSGNTVFSLVGVVALLPDDARAADARLARGLHGFGIAYGTRGTGEYYHAHVDLTRNNFEAEGRQVYSFTSRALVPRLPGLAAARTAAMMDAELRAAPGGAEKEARARVLADFYDENDLPEFAAALRAGKFAVLPLARF